MSLSRSQITIMVSLLIAMIMGGNALAQRYDSYYSQQQMQRQQQMQQQQMQMQQQQAQMQRQQEQMRRQQEQARQQQAAIRQQQAEQQRMVRAQQQEAQRVTQQQRDQALQQRQLALDRQRQASSQRIETQSKKTVKDQVLAKQQTVDRSVLKQRGLEKNRQERLLRLKQDFLQKQRVTSGKANIPQPARPLTLSEKFKANSGAKNITAYQRGKPLTTKELAAQRQAVQLLAKKVKAKAAASAQKKAKAALAAQKASENFQVCDLSGKCTCSFHGDTQVLTRQGFRAIKSLVAGQDYVWSRNEYTGDMDWKSVTAHYSNLYEETVEVTIRSLENGDAQTIVSNRIHPFYVNNHGIEENKSTRHEKAGTNATGRWVEAQYLKPGDLLLTSSGTIAETLSARVKKISLIAYNLSVSDYRTYFVKGIDSNKESSVWVHNECHDPSAKDSITRASVSDKLDRYLLNKDHPVGGSKAKWFDQALGFNNRNAAGLAKQVVFDEKSAVKTVLTQYGQKFNQIIPIKGANGRVIDVKFSWIRNTDGVVRLVTAIPAKK